jgi:hypothetical protein
MVGASGQLTDGKKEEKSGVALYDHRRAYSKGT